MSPTASVSHTPQEVSEEGRGPHWRPDIQGLRAIAVLMVVTFHAGLPVAGGFFGVDVFFVISGYVITGLLLREKLQSGRIALRRFYWRRFKRLMPALAVLVVVTSVLSTALLSPLGPQEIAGTTGIAAMLFGANFFISQRTGNYFDPSAEFNPLLNTWSLSVEEQFYFVLPAVLLIVWMGSSRAWVRPRAALAVALVLAVSLALTLAGAWFSLGTRLDLVVDPFYSPVTRAWEFAAGALLAITGKRVIAPLVRRRLLHVVGAVGIVMIAAAWIGVGAQGPVPGPWTLLPVFGAVFVILAGNAGAAPSTRVLSRPGLVRLGDWSYSIYLWHWPLIVFAAVLFPGSPQVLVLASLVSLAPALLSYRFVEQPLRTAAIVQRGRRVLLVGTVMLIPIAVSMGSLLYANGVLRPQYESGQFRLLKGDLGPESWRDSFTSMYAPCSSMTLREYVPDWEGLEMCRQSIPGQPPSVAVIGDSHSQDLFIALADKYPSTNVVSLGFGGIAPSLRGSIDMQSALKEVAQDPQIQVVVLAAKWEAYDSTIGEGVVEALTSMSSVGKKVFVAEDVPSFSFDPEQCAMRRVPILPGSKCDESRSEALKVDPTFQASIQSASSASDNIYLIDLGAVFCDASDCSMRNGNDVLFRDRDHLTLEGSQLIGRVIPKLSPSLNESMDNASAS